MSSWTGCTSTSDANAWNRCANMSFETALPLQLRSERLSDSLGHHDSAIMDGSDDGWVGRGDAGAVGVVVAGREGADRAAVPASAHGAFCGVVPGCAPWAGAAQDGLDAGGGGGR